MTLASRKPKSLGALDAAAHIVVALAGTSVVVVVMAKLLVYEGSTGFGIKA
jgi:hypothetical protein